VRNDPTAMFEEIRAAPEAAARFFDRESANLAVLGQKIRAINPAVVVTCARGSSDHAAGYFKYLAEILCGVPVASLGPSLASIYDAPLRLNGAVLISVSQSGASPDIVALQRAAREAGAYAIAVVNDAASPLGAGADAILPLHAGPERSIAATKTFLSSAIALAGLVAAWRADAALADAARGLPAVLARAVEIDWSVALPDFVSAASTYVIGRGCALPIGMEAALKLKETAMLHAEAFSGAEVMHGPLQLVADGFPVLALRQRDASFAAMGDTMGRLAAAGGKVFALGEAVAKVRALPIAPPSGSALLDPLAMLASFYRFAEALARARGHDPDRPARLRKVTRTL